MRQALLIGINKYAVEGSDLDHCINDANDLAAHWTREGYVCQTLCDERATKEAIVRGIRATLSALSKGEVGVICFSGHGTWTPDLDGDEPDHHDEAWCPYDLGDWDHLLVDDELAKLLADRPTDTGVFLVSDSCHSGTVLASKQAGRKTRYLPPSRWLKNRSTASALEFKQPKLKATPPLPGVVFISGCADDELSDETLFDGRGNGVLTHFLLEAFARVGPNPSPRELYAALRFILPTTDYPQTPQLHCEQAAMDKPILG